MLNTSVNERSRLKVVILSRNREGYLKESLKSVIDSANKMPFNVQCHIEISDNSDNERCVTLVKEKYPQIHVVARRPNLSAIDHLVEVLKENSSDYLVIFHDDDIMKPNFLPTLYGLITSNKNASAVGCNALHMHNHMESKDLFLKQGKSLIYIDNPDMLINRYFSYDAKGVAPFPGYMYRTSKIRGLYPKYENGGKYADVSFLFEVAKRGVLIWTSEILMNYRWHESNGSGVVSIPNQISLLRYLRRNVSEKKSRALRDFRFSIMFNWLKSKVNKNYNYFQWNKSQQAVFKFLIYGVIHRLIFIPESRSFFFRKLIDFLKI